MSVVCYFKEPANYTLDLKAKVYDDLEIQTRFLSADSLASNSKISSLKQLPFLAKMKLLWNDCRQFQVIIFNGFYDFELFCLLFFSCLQKNKISIGLESDTPLKIPANPFKRMLKAGVLTFLFKNKRIYGLAGGNFLHKALFRHYGMNESKILFLPMVIDVENYLMADSSENTHFTFLYVGNLYKEKNVRQLILSFKAVSEKAVNVQLKIVGTGALLNDLRSEFSRMKNLEFTGGLYGKELRDIYLRSNVFVFPSLIDNWGLVVNEAMASGLAVISSKFVGANADLLEGKATGFIYDPEEKGDLTKKMLELYTNKGLYQEYSKNAFDLLHQNWNYDLYRRQLLLALDRMEA
jgi:glycosyltransferase involved in cell wall biosynthesis